MTLDPEHEPELETTSKNSTVGIPHGPPALIAVADPATLGEIGPGVGHAV